VDSVENLRREVPHFCGSVYFCKSLIYKVFIPENSLDTPLQQP